ncbi:MAG: hypothetical protein ACRD0J_15085, partial [Acidimicrobiales bacterium]
PPGSAGRPPVARAAWVAGGGLHVMTGKAGRTVKVPLAPGQLALDPSWSPDGRWLAYLVGQQSASGPGSAGYGPTPTGPYQLRVVRGDGTGDHQVFTSADYFASVQWSPTADVLAVVPTTAKGASQGLVLVGLGGTTHRLLADTTLVGSVVWSRDGRVLAYATPVGMGTSQRSSLVFTIPASGGHPTRVPYSPPAGSSVLLAGWWPDGKGLLAWTDPLGSASIGADGLPLTAVPIAGGPAHVLATTLEFLPWVTWSPDGRHLLIVEGSGRSPAKAKTLALCQPGTWTCKQLAQPAGTVSLDPTWSPDGSHIAFVRAKEASSLSACFASRRLWVANADGSGAHPVGPVTPPGLSAQQMVSMGSGVTQPAWAPDGSTLSYSTGGAVVRVNLDASGSLVLASALSGPGAGKVGPDAYGKSPWRGVATWDTSPGTAGTGPR